MRILVALENADNIKEIEISLDDTLETLRYIIEAEFSVPYLEQELKYAGKIISGDSSLISQLKIDETEILVVGRKKLAFSTNNVNTNQTLASVFDETMKKMKENKPIVYNNNSMLTEKVMLDMQVKKEASELKQFYSNSPGDLAVLFNTDQKLAEAIVGGDDSFLESFIRKRLEKVLEKKKKDQEEYNKLMRADPNDKDVQLKIEEMIKWKNIDENFKMAQEYLPMTFSNIFMLYIPLEINKTNITALVDTGAQMTIMGQDCCKKCGLFNMVDTRRTGTAIGVGTTKIIGVIHAAQIKINDR